MNTRSHAVLIVVYTLAAVVLVYVLTLSACALFSIRADDKIIMALKDIGLVCAGSIGSLLARTSNTDPAAGTVEDPIKTEVVNETNHPVPTTDTK